MASGNRTRVEVLGTLRVLDADGRDVTPPGALQRRVLSLLVLKRGQRVSVDAATEALWPADPPVDPVGAIQNHLSRVRKILPTGAVTTVGDAYQLDAGLIDVDSDHLAELVSRASVGDLDDSDVAEVDALLDRWQGPAYADLLDVEEARYEEVRLAELRSQAREIRALAKLRTGAAGEALAELSALVTDDPLRERPRSLLMDALAATGRRAEALRVYDDFRRLLGDELGIEPSPVLSRQHAALLEGGPAAPPPDPGLRAGRLPRPPSSLIGRDELVDAALELTSRSRLLTLVGPGGVGKTRLLIELGHRLRSDRPERPVVLCELAAADRGSVVNVVAAALGIDVRPGIALADQVGTVLEGDEVVLLADNCEHVIGSTAELVHQLLARCPNLTVVATSRERLRVPGEQVHVVPPLGFDGEDSAALRLFVERASAAAPGFDPGPQDVAAIHEIVGRLDGLPLAIELAAARLFTLDVREVLAGLDHRFSLLTAGARTSPRHETLAAAIWWSHDLLDEPLREVFAALSVFVTPFSAGDAAAVTGLDEVAATEALTELTERSILQRTPDRRYVMLESLRAFGAERLEEGDRSDPVSDRHARRMIDRVEAAARALLAPGRSAIDEMDASLPELHAALGWLEARSDRDLAGRLTGAFLDYGLLRLRPDVFEWARRVRAIDPTDQGPHAPRMWVLATYAAWMGGDLVEAERCARRAMDVALQRSGPVPPEVHTVAGNIAMFSGDLAGAQRCYQRATGSAEDDDSRRLLTAGTELLALGYSDHPGTAARAEAVLEEVGDVRSAFASYLWYCAGEAVLATDPPLARRRFERAVELARETGASFVEGVAGASLTSMDARTGDPERAAADYRALIDHWRRAGMWSTQWTMLRSIAGLLHRLGRPREAAVLLGAVRATEAGHRIYGSDEITMQELEAALRADLGDEVLRAEMADGAVLDGSAAVEHALRCL